uniref:Beta-defensin n=1 Tax=Castor canadensis TaxID=51338 RepID=A0A8B7V2R5_CASCN|nr:beta-defensin 112 [Castor canadensis]
MAVNSDVPVASPAFSCLQKFEKLNSKKSNSFTIFGKERYDENNTARSNKHHILFNWWDACTKIGGQCKNQCGHGEFRIIYCARPTTHCCVKECDPTQ